MIRALLPVVLSLAAFSAGAIATPPKKYAELKLRNGETLRSVVVTAAEPDGLRVRHDSGAGKIRIEELPDTVREDFGIDTLSASDFRMGKKLEQDGLDGAARDMKVRMLKETPRLEQDQQQERLRKEIFSALGRNDYNFAELDTRLMERASLWRDAGRPDLAAVLESDRATLRSRESNRVVPGDNAREEELQARLRNLENRPAPAALSPAPAVYRSTYVRSPYPSSFWNYYPAQVVRHYHPSYCRPTNHRPAPVVRPAPVGNSNGVVQGSHLWRKR